MANNVNQLLAQPNAEQFWQDFLQYSLQALAAQSGSLLTRASAESPWQSLASDDTGLAEWAAGPDGVGQSHNGVTIDGARACLVLDSLSSGRELLLCFALQSANSMPHPDSINAIGQSLSLLVNTYLQRFNDPQQQALSSAQQVLSWLEQLQSTENFAEACLLVCNRVAAHYQCQQVGLGWTRQGHIKLQAVSNKAHFDKRAEWVDQIEAAMQEALDQSCSLAVSATGEACESGSLVLQHRQYLASAANRHLLSVPLLVAGEAVAALLLERQQQPFSQVDGQILQRLGAPVAHALDQQQQASGPLWRQMLRPLRNRVNALFEIQHMGAKLAGVGVALAFLLLCIVPFPYRVSGNFIIEAEQQVVLSSMRDGLLRTVAVQAGDEIQAGQLLLQLDDIDLRLREAELLSELTGAQADMERAMSLSEFAELRIAQAQTDQLQAELEWVRLQIAAGEMVAPSAGILISDEGLSRRVGSPVSRGEALLTIAKPESWSVMVEIDEQEIDHLNDNAGGEIAFVSRPSDRLQIQVQRIELMARSRDTGPVFRVFAQVDNDTPQWWKPGMTGVAKLDAGYKPLMWIWTHRFFDWLRLRLWF